MTTIDLLAFGASVAFAAPIVSEDFTIHYGRTSWHQQINALTEEQRAALEARIGQWHAGGKGEVAHANG